MAKVGTSALEAPQARLPAVERHRRAAQGRVAARGHSAGARDGRSRLAAAARTPFPVAGRNALATIRGQLTNMRDGRFHQRARPAHLDALIAEVCVAAMSTPDRW
jgi:3-hydroxyacyl-CoA dehydrogenase